MIFGRGPTWVEPAGHRAFKGYRYQTSAVNPQSSSIKIFAIDCVFAYLAIQENILITSVNARETLRTNTVTKTDTKQSNSTTIGMQFPMVFPLDFQYISDG